MGRNKNGVCYNTYCKGIAHQSLHSQQYGKPLYFSGHNAFGLHMIQKAFKIYWGLCWMVFVLGFFFHTLEEIQFLVFMVAPINKLIPSFSFFTVLLVSYFIQHPQLFPATCLQAAVVSCCFPLWLSQRFISLSFNIILQLSG